MNFKLSLPRNQFSSHFHRKIGMWLNFWVGLNFYMGFQSLPSVSPALLTPCTPDFHLTMLTPRSPLKTHLCVSALCSLLYLQLSRRLSAGKLDHRKESNVIYSSIEVYEPYLYQTYRSQGTFLMHKETAPITKATRNPRVKLFCNPDFHLSSLPIKLNYLCKIML